jgi:hypothetical protein
MKTVTGPRSPRWALWQRTVIPCRDGLVYLVRRRVIQTPWFAIYLHDIHEADADRDPHNHPWTFWSMVLRGSYTEQLHTVPYVHLDTWRINHWGRFSLHRMGRETAHRITEAEPGLKTLVITGRRRSSWGFFTQPWGGFVDWRDYEQEYRP